MLSLELRVTFDRDCFHRDSIALYGFTLNRNTKRAQHTLRMVARRTLRLNHFCAPVGIKTCEQYAGLHLRARNRHLVADCFERSAAFDSQGSATLSRRDARTHHLKRLNDSL